MADQQDDDRQREREHENEYVKGGKGRKDEVGRSGIYPASSPDAPADAEVRTEGELVGHPRRRRQDEDQTKTDESTGSE